MPAFHWDGFDLYGSNADGALAYDNGSLTINTSNSRTGSQAVYGSNLRKAFPATIGNLASVYQGIAWKRSSGGAQSVLRFMDSSSLQVHIEVQDDLSIRAQRGSNTLYTTAPGTAPTTGVYGHMIAFVTIHPSAGLVKVWVNGVLVIDLSGQNTRNTANSYCNMAELNTTGAYLDDWWISTENEGDCRVVEDRPTGAGDQTQFASSGVNPNHQNVDETGASNGDTDYNVSATPGQVDTYAYPALSLNGVVKGVKTIAMVRGDVGSKVLRPVVSIGGTPYTGVQESINTTYAVRGTQTVWTSNPATSGTWSIAAAEAARLGIEHVS